MNTTPVRKELNELKRIIKGQYPEAIFRVTEGPEPAPRRLWLNVYLNTVDMEAIHKLVSDRELDVLLNKGYALYVMPHDLAYLPARVRNGKTRPAASYPRPRATAQGRVMRERKATYQAKTKKRGKK